MIHQAKWCWIDLEMTGLQPQVDYILEVACIITDTQGNCVSPEFHAVIHYDVAALPPMSDWVLEQHTRSGLLAQVAASENSLQDVAERLRTFIARYGTVGQTYLAGNTVYQDKMFLRSYMPLVDQLLHYRIIDVSSIKEIVKCWYPISPQSDFKKSSDHRALTDIQESIAELLWYRTYFFKGLDQQ